MVYHHPPLGPPLVVVYVRHKALIKPTNRTIIAEPSITALSAARYRLPRSTNLAPRTLSEKQGLLDGAGVEEVRWLLGLRRGPIPCCHR